MPAAASAAVRITGLATGIRDEATELFFSGSAGGTNVAGIVM